MLTRLCMRSLPKTKGRVAQCENTSQIRYSVASIRCNLFIIQRLAERVGFEPTSRFRENTLSKRAPSATRTSLREASMFARSLTRRLLGWRRERDSNPRYPYGYSGFRDRPIQPLSHLSAEESTRSKAAFPARKPMLGLDFGAPREYDLRRFIPPREGFPCSDPVRT